MLVSGMLVIWGPNHFGYPCLDTKHLSPPFVLEAHQTMLGQTRESATPSDIDGHREHLEESLVKAGIVSYDACTQVDFSGLFDVTC